MLVHDIIATDSSVVIPTDNGTFLTESTFSNWTFRTTVLPTTSLGPLLNVTSSWGPKRDPLYIVVPITVIYAVILLTGLLGNVSTCIVIARNKHMHTATNYYLFSLAVSDLLLLVSGLPQEMYYNWSRYPYIFGEVFCVLQGFAAETSANATVLTITAFTVERYVAICHPFQSHSLSKLSRAVRLILMIWLLAMGLAVPQALQFGVVYEELDGRMLDDEHTVCAVKRVVIPHSFEVSSLVFFVVPMTLISVLYALIGLQLRRSSLRRGGGSVRLKTGVGGNEVGYNQYCPPQQTEDGRKNFSKNAQIKATKHVVKMLVAVVVAFFICWAPFHAQRLLAVYATGNSDERPSASMIIVYHTVTYTSGVLYYLSTTVNPVLYHIMSHKFREAFKDTLARYLGRRRARGGRWQCYTVLSGRSSRHSNTSNPPSNASICGTGSLRRYLETDMALLHGSRRPIVVSFRRHHTQFDSTGDTEVSGGSTSTGAEVYVSLEELTKNSHLNSRKNSKKVKKTRNKLNETYLSVICRHSKSDAKERISQEGSEKEDTYSAFTSSSTSSFPYSTNKENQSDEALVPSWHNENESKTCLPMEICCEISEKPLELKNGTKNFTANTPDCSETKYPKVEDIEIFQEQQLKIQSSFKKRHRNSKHNRNLSKVQKTPNSLSNNIEYNSSDSRDKLSISCNGNTNYIPGFIDFERNEVRYTSVPRSVTVPSIGRIIKDTQPSFGDTCVEAMDLPAHSPKQSEAVKIRNKMSNERYKLTPFTKQCRDNIFEEKQSNIDANSECLDSKLVSKSEPLIRYIATESQNHLKTSINVIESQKQKLCTLINNADQDSFNNNIEDVETSSRKSEKSSINDGEVIYKFNQIDLSSSPLHVRNKIEKHCCMQQEIKLENNKEISSFKDLSSTRNDGVSIDLDDAEYNNVIPLRNNCLGKRGNTSDVDEENSSVPENSSSTKVYDASISLSYLYSRPKSCTDLSATVKLGCELFSTAMYSSSPRLANCDLTL